MSTTVDQRVVEMQFDNRHFEKNVQTSMSTLDRLKKSLNLDGAAKGFDNVSNAAKKVDMNGLSRGIDTVKARFSAMEVIGVTALANITNSAVNAGKRMISALTIDPITTGFKEYETKMNSIQTILSNTASKGTTMDDVTRTLNDLNLYADKTIYNFQEMTRNIGTFTAAGIGLEESATAIQGIANLAAASGSNAQQASTAMYQLSQALASGTVKLMDWNSVVNAGMGGELFQNALKDTARTHGVAVDEIIKKNGSFRESLREGWITSEILIETLGKMTKTGAAEYLSKLTGIEQSQIEATQKLVDENKDGKASYEELASQMAATGKITKDEAINILKLADNAENAATKVKTFTQLWDTLKEAAQSGWAQTWEIIVGDFEKAKDLLTKISDVVGGFINKMSEWRNNLLRGALDFGTPWASIKEKLENSGIGKMIKGVENVSEKVNKATHSLEQFQDIVSKVWRGDYGNADTGRYDKLDSEGWDHRVVQDLVNKTEGDKSGAGLTIDDVNESYAKFGITLEDTSKSADKTSKSVGKLTDEQLKAAGLTAEEIKLYRDLEKEAERTGRSIDELAEAMSKRDGRTLLIESISNACQGLISIFKALGQAWLEIFPPMSSVRLYTIIEGINKFSQHLRMSDETADKLKRTFKGLFAIIDIIATFMNLGFKIAFEIVSAILKVFNLDILSVTAAIGDAIVKFRDWIDRVLDFTGVIEFLAPIIKKCVSAIVEWVKSIKDSKAFKAFANVLGNIANRIKEWFINLKNSGAFAKFVKMLGNGVKVLGKWIAGIKDTKAFKTFLKMVNSAWAGIKKWFAGLKTTDNIPKYIFESIGKALKNGMTMIGKALSTVGSFILDKIKLIPGVGEWFDSLKESDNIARDIILGLVNGLGAGLTWVWNAAVDLAEAVLTAVKDFLGIHSPSREFIEVGKNVIQGFVEGIGEGVLTAVEVMQEFALAVIGGFQSVLDSPLMQTVKDNFRNIFKGFIGVLETGLENIKYMFQDMAAWLEKFNLGEIINKIISYAVAFGAIWFVKQIGDLIGGLGRFLDGISDMAKTFKKVGNSLSTALKAEAMKSFAIALAILVGAIIAAALAIKYVGWQPMLAAVVGLIVVMGALIGLIIAMGVANKHAQKAAKDAKGGKAATMPIVGLVLGLAATLVAIALLCNVVDTMSNKDVHKVGVVLVALAVLLGGLITVAIVMAKMQNEPLKAVDHLGKAMFGIGVSIALTAVALKLIASISREDLIKAGATLAVLAVFIGALIVCAGVAGMLAKNSIKYLGKVMMGVGVAFMLIAASLKLIGSMDRSEIQRAMDVITPIGIFIGILMLISGLAGALNDNGFQALGNTMMGVGVAFALMALSLKIIASIEDGLLKAVAVIGFLTLLIAGLILVVSLFTPVVGKKETIMDMGKTILMIAAAMVLLAGLCVVLSMLDAEQIWPGLKCVAVLTAMMMLLMICAGTMEKDILGPMIVLTAIIAILGGILIALSCLDPYSVTVATACMSALLILVGVIVGLTHLVPKEAQGPLVALAVIIGLLGATLILLSQQPWDQTISAAIGMSVAILAIAGAMKIMATIKNFDVKPLWSMIAAVAVIGLIVAILSACPFEGVLAAAGALTIMLAAMIGAMYLLGMVPKFDITPLATMIIAVGMIGVLLAILAPLPIQSTLGAVLALSIMLLALSGAMLILSNTGSIPLSTVATLIAVALALGILGQVLASMGGMSWEGMAKGLVAIGGSLLILAIGLNLMNGTLAGSAAMLIAAAALAVLAPTLMMLGSMSWESLLISLVALAGAFVVLGLAGLLLGPLVPVILGLAAAIALIGAGFLMAGVGALTFGMGLSLIASGFALLATSVSENSEAFTEGLSTIITGMLELIPDVVEAIVEGIGAFCEAIITVAPQIGEAVLVIGQVVLKVIGELLPQILVLFAELLTGTLELIAEYTPRIAQAAFDIIIAILDAIAANIGRIIQAGVDIIVAFVRGVGQAIPQLVDAAYKAMIDFINGMADAIRNNNQALIDAVNNLMDAVIEAIGDWFEDFKGSGKNLIEGFIKGIKNMAKDAANAAKDIGSKALNGLKNILGIKSPSREAAELGEYFDEGFSLGIDDNSGMVENSAFDLGALAALNLQDGFDGQNLIDMSGVKMDTPEMSLEDDKEKVKELQQMLMDLGYDLGEMGADGIFGPKTQAALEEFERRSGLTIDGVLSETDITAITNKWNKAIEDGTDINILTPEQIREYEEMMAALGIISADAVDGVLDEFEKASLSDWMMREWQIAAGATSDITLSSLRDSHNSLLKSIGQDIAEWTPEMIAEAEKSLIEGGYLLEEQATGVIGPAFLNAMNAAIEDAGGKALNWSPISTRAYQAVVGDTKNYVKAFFTDDGFIVEGYGALYDVAGYAVDGLVDGVDANLYKTGNAGASIAKSLQSGFTRALQIHSPSRVFKNLARWIPEGLALGIDKYSGVVDGSSKSMAERAIDSVRSTIGRIADAINSDIDSQPTIRPVLDLSGVQLGANAIDGLLNGGATIGVMANASGISSMMNRRIQNGTTSDVVSAIDKLRSDISNLGGNTYTINGVTYDDGTNVSNAVRDLVRAARIERRV